MLANRVIIHQSVKLWHYRPQISRGNPVCFFWSTFPPTFFVAIQAEPFQGFYPVLTGTTRAVIAKWQLHDSLDWTSFRNFQALLQSVDGLAEFPDTNFYRHNF